MEEGTRHEQEQQQHLPQCTTRDRGEPSSSTSSSRMALLEDSFTKCLQFGLAQPSYRDMQSYFPGCPEAVIHALLGLFQQILAHTLVNSQAEFKDICNEHGIQARLAEVERLSAQAQADVMQRSSGSTEFQAAIDASEKHARVAAKQQEMAHLQHLLDQAASTRDHLLEAAAQKQAEVQKQVDAYSGVGADVKQVFEASSTWAM